MKLELGSCAQLKTNVMTQERYCQLMENDELPLTTEEINLGWHFCHEFDGLLVGPEMHELYGCTCLPGDHPVYKTKPESEQQNGEITPF